MPAGGVLRTEVGDRGRQAGHAAELDARAGRAARRHWAHADEEPQRLQGLQDGAPGDGERRSVGG